MVASKTSSSTLPQLLCARAKDMPAGTVIPPEIRSGYCGGCGAKVLMSPASAGMVKRGEARPVCKACLAGPNLLPVMTAEQLAELEGYGAGGTT